MPLTRGWSFRSLASSVASRKSNKSNKSLRSNVTITSTRSTGSYIRKNSGNFDGGNTRNRRKSSSLSRKASTTSNRDQKIADFYKELEQLQELSSSSSEDEDDSKPKNKKLEKLETENSKRRVEEYVMKHSMAGQVEMDEDEGFDTNSETKSRNSASSDVRRRSYEKCRMEDDVFESITERYGGKTHGNDSFTKGHNTCNQDTKRHQEQIYREHSKNKRQEVTSPTKRIESTKLHLRDVKYRSKEHTQPDPYENFLNHKDVTRKMNDLLVDMNDNDIVEKTSRKSRSTKLRSSTLPTNDYSRRAKTKAEIVRDLSGSESSLSSADSAHGSTRSISTVSSCSNTDKFSPRIHRTSGNTQNFISPATHKSSSSHRSRHKSLPNGFNYGSNTSFCFKGIICRIQQDTPRTFKAFAHAGCMALVIAGPSVHKCQL